MKLDQAYEVLQKTKENGVNFDIKVSGLTEGQFNEMEGYQYNFNLTMTIKDKTKVFKSNKRRSKRISVLTNSTYLEDQEFNNLKELKKQLEEYYLTAID